MENRFRWVEVLHNDIISPVVASCTPFSKSLHFFGKFLDSQLLFRYHAKEAFMAVETQTGPKSWLPTFSALESATVGTFGKPTFGIWILVTVWILFKMWEIGNLLKSAAMLTPIIQQLPDLHQQCYLVLGKKTGRNWWFGTPKQKGEFH